MKFSSTDTAPRASYFTPRLSSRPFLTGPVEPHGQQHEIGVHLELGTGHRLKLAVFKLNPVGMEFCDVAIVAGELRRRDAPLPVTALFMRVGRA